MTPAYVLLQLLRFPAVRNQSTLIVPDRALVAGDIQVRWLNPSRFAKSVRIRNRPCGRNLRRCLLQLKQPTSASDSSTHKFRREEKTRSIDTRRASAREPSPKPSGS